MTNAAFEQPPAAAADDKNYRRVIGVPPHVQWDDLLHTAVGLSVCNDNLFCPERQSARMSEIKNVG